MDTQVLQSKGEPVEPVESAVADECRKKLPNAYNRRWSDLRGIVHNCTWFLCELLHQLQGSRLPLTTVAEGLNDVMLVLVEVACRWPDDVCIASLNIAVW